MANEERDAMKISTRLQAYEFQLSGERLNDEWIEAIMGAPSPVEDGKVYIVRDSLRGREVLREVGAPEDSPRIWPPA